MIGSFITVSTGTLASRLLGFARDSMIAALIGTGPVADAFLVAFQLVTMVRRLLTEGALNAALVPVWLRLRDTEGEAKAAAFAGRVLATLSAALVALTALIGALMPLVLVVVAPGFAGGATLRLAVDNARLMLPYLAFAGPSTVLLALLAAQSRYALAAFSPLVFNVALIAVMAALIPARPDPALVARSLAATIGVAGALQLCMLVLRGRTGGLAGPLRITLGRDMRGFFARAVPGMVANSAPQLLLVGGAVIASAQPSAVSWLYFASRLIELPLGIVGVAMGTVVVSELTRGVRDGDDGVVAVAQSHALELAAGLALPSTLGLIVLSAPVVRLLFEHGAFTSADTAATAQSLVFLAFALPAHVLSKALSPAFFAREDTRTPLHASVVSLAVAIIAAFALDHLFGAGFVALGIALGAWSGALFLGRRAAFGGLILPATRGRLLRIVAAAFAMAVPLWCAARLVAFDPPAQPLAQAAAVGLLIAGAVLVYLLLLALFGVTDWRAMVAVVRRGRPRDLRK